MTTHATSVELTATEKAAFLAAMLRAREAFSRIDGVLSVGFGQKHTAGDFRDIIAITACVLQKKPLEALTNADRIPSTFEGYPTDVMQVGTGSAPAGCNNSQDYKMIRGGIQIVPQIVKEGYTFEKGTLGCIVRRRGDSDRENVYLLTCKHVLFAGGAKDGNYVYHPFAEATHGQNSAGPANVLGPIQAKAIRDNVSYTPAGSSTAKQFHLDCAIARIDIDSKCFGSTCTKDHVKYAAEIVELNAATDAASTSLNPANMISDVRSVIDDSGIINKKVFKVGRATGKTQGTVKIVTASEPLIADPDDPHAPSIALNVIRIDFDKNSTPNHVNCLGNERFAEGGDSGSIVVDENGKAIGLVAISAAAAHANDPPPKTYPTFACHIVPVLDLLNICIPTSGGASHGSCLATDGSGLKSAPPPPVANPTGKPVFQSHITSAAPVAFAEPVAFEPAHVTDEQATRMLAFRDALVTTPQGRELHDTFVRVRRELGYLVRKSRPVKVVWHRNHGPAFFAHILNHLKGDTPSVPHEIGGISRADFLTRMGAALSAHGSIPLRDAIARYRTELMPTLIDADDVNDCLSAIRSRGSAAAREEGE
jgi:hypothetical protein